MPRRTNALLAHLRRGGLALVLAASTAALPPRPALADAIREGLGLSGFFDVRAADSRTDPNVFSMGDFELDLAREIGKSVQLAAAIVVGDEGAELAVGFVDIHILGGLVAPRGRLPIEKGFHVQLGRFDVPFGNDWRYFAAKDRTELTAPVTTSLVMDGGANDAGLRIFGNTGSLHYSGYVLHGEAKGPAVGGRLGFTPFDNPYRLRGRIRAVEVGVSFLDDFDGDGGREATSFALDTEIRARLLRLRAEYLRRDLRPGEGRDERVIRSGWHVTATVDAGAPAGIPMTPYARYDTATDDPVSESGPLAEAPGGGRIERFTAGVNATVLEILSVKVEYQRALSMPATVEVRHGFHRDSWQAQVVVSF